MLYEVAVLEIPTAKEEAAGKEESLLVAPTCTIAEDDRSAAIAVAIERAAQLEGVPPSKRRFLVRPFV